MYAAIVLFAISFQWIFFNDGIVWKAYDFDLREQSWFSVCVASGAFSPKKLIAGSVFFFGSSILADGDLFEVGHPSRLHSLSSLRHLLVVARLSRSLDSSLWLDLSRMVPDAMEMGSLCMSILVLCVHLGVLGEISLRLEVVLDFVDDWSGGAEVPVVGLDLGGLFEASLWLQVVLDGGHDVRASGRLGLVGAGSLALGGQGCLGQPKAGGTAEVGAWLASMTEEFHFRCPLSCSVVGQESG